MKLFHIAFILLLITAPNDTKGQITPSQLQASVNAGIDPYFIASTDTISRYGPRSITRDLIQDKHGNYWLASWQGIIKYDGELFTNYTLKEGLIKFHIISAYRDRLGNLWFGTARGGLYRYNGQSFKLFTTKEGLADNSVTCFAEDKKGNIWFGTENGASRYDGKTFTNFSVTNGLPGKNVRAILLSESGRLWFGCGASTYMANDGGISSYDGKSFTSLKSIDSLSWNVTSLLEDRSGNIWIGTMNGLTKYDGTSLRSIAEIPSSLVYYIIQDKEGLIWFTSGAPNPIYKSIATQILYSYDGKTFTKTIERSEPGDHQIFGKLIDGDGKIWFGTMKGLCNYDGKTINIFTN
jgi:ligand-binding sensor domain-containing protein